MSRISASLEVLRVDLVSRYGEQDELLSAFDLDLPPLATPLPPTGEKRRKSSMFKFRSARMLESASNRREGLRQ